MLIGSITNQGSLQGEMNNANGYLTGVIKSAGQLGGQIVGLRGLKGDTGATGNGIASVSKTGSSGLVDTYTITYTDGTTATFTLTNGKDGIDGIDGVDGHSPVVTASKVGKVTTVYVDGSPIATLNDGNDGVGVPVGGTIGQVLTKDSGTDYDVSWEDPSGGASAFIAEYGVTSYADVKDAYDDDAIILCTVDDSGNTVICQLAYYDDENGAFYFSQPQSDGAYWAGILIDDTWVDGYFQFASTDTATQIRDGLMSALDWQKLDGIASGAEVNVQSDWNEADNTKDDFIKNKPTIPSKTSDLNNDSGFITAGGLLNMFYPVGSYYETSDSTFDPNVRWGGTWVLESEGLVHIGAGLNYTVGDTGGEAEVTLSTDEIPAHTHGSKTLTGTLTSRRQGADYVSFWGSGIVSISAGGANVASNGVGTSNKHADVATINATHEHDSVGGGGAHNNMPPYVVVNRWHRTA